MNIQYIHEPTDLQCGQAVLAMLLGTAPEYICSYLGNDRETDLREMKRVLTDHGIKSTMNESRRRLFPTFPYAPSSALRRPDAGIGRCMPTAFFTTLSMAC